MTITHLQAQIDQVTLGRVLRYRASSSHHHLHHHTLFLDPALSGLAIAIRRRMAIAIGSSWSVWRTQHLGFWSAGREVAAACAAGSAMLRDSLPDILIFDLIGDSLSLTYIISLPLPSWHSWPPSLRPSSNFSSCSEHMHDYYILLTTPLSFGQARPQPPPPPSLPDLELTFGIRTRSNLQDSLSKTLPSSGWSRPSSPTSRLLTDLAFPQSFVINAFNTLARRLHCRLSVPPAGADIRPLTDLQVLSLMPSIRSLEDSAVVWGIPPAGADIPTINRSPRNASPSSSSFRLVPLTQRSPQAQACETVGKSSKPPTKRPRSSSRGGKKASGGRGKKKQPDPSESEAESEVAGVEVEVVEDTIELVSEGVSEGVSEMPSDDEEGEDSRGFLGQTLEKARRSLEL
ncbi:hypothetical protein BDZ89DRAFT_1148372 [Hymenopellis radicata]|nr:hypothetical protein BDZ89DRAFT_1148372 [Hymenopellis radicata]